MKYHQQFDETDCGPACLAMIASHYKLFKPLAAIRHICGTDTSGTNLQGLVTAAQKLGFKATPLRGAVQNETLDKKLGYPFIAHVKIPVLNFTSDHFVVIKKINSKKVEIWDPDPSKGVYRMERSSFLKIWSGYVLFLSPDSSFKPEKEKGNILFKFIPLLLPYKREFALVTIASALVIILGILVSFYFKYVIDEVITSKAEFTLSTLSIIMLFSVIMQVVIEVLRSILINHFSYKADLRLNFSYIIHVLKLPLSFFDSRKTGEILSRLGDIGKIRGALSGTALSVVMDTALLVVIGPILFKTSPALFSISIINVLLISVIVFFFSKIFRKNYTRLMQEEAETSSRLVETISGAYTVKALNAETRMFEEYEKLQMKAIWTSWKTSRFGILQGFLTGVIGGVCGVINFWIGSSFIISGAFSFGTLISFNALSGYFTGPLFRLVNLQASLQEAFVAAERVGEILELEPEQDDTLNLLKPASLNGMIAFDNVTFRYGTRKPVYEHLSFAIEKGQWAAFVGPSGCGKTTLVKLLLKFYSPEEGSVRIDAHDLRDIDAVSLRSRIGYVPQDVFIFSGTIAENIALHKEDASLEEIVEAAEQAGAAEFINNLPLRYNTKLGEHGSTLSGGERQRLALARALIGRPDILILDEATSNLDSVSENMAHRVIEKVRGGITTIIIAHRLTTVKNCDVIFVMDKGGVMEKGTHGELLARKGLYASLWEGTAV
ncbi:MAG: peptidase domain-containing ABC transporter [Treponema sp.]|jgi:ATP-binding cassette subfamily B protein|nr:peptidase domain-containing ABC transporter [Treponema sp.]